MVTIEENVLGSEERRDAVEGMSRSVTNVRILPSMKRAFISHEERWCRTYVTEVLAYVNNCYVRQTLSYGRINLLGNPTEKCKTYKEVE